MPRSPPAGHRMATPCKRIAGAFRDRALRLSGGTKRRANRQVGQGLAAGPWAFGQGGRLAAQRMQAEPTGEHLEEPHVGRRRLWRVRLCSSPFRVPDVFGTTCSIHSGRARRHEGRLKAPLVCGQAVERSSLLNSGGHKESVELMAGKWVSGKWPAPPSYYPCPDMGHVRGSQPPELHVPAPVRSVHQMQLAPGQMEIGGEGGGHCLLEWE